MTPNDFEAYLAVLVRQNAMAAAVELPGGVKFSVSFAPPMPPEVVGGAPQPGAWKGNQLNHLDQPDALRGDGEFKGTLPS